MPRSDSVARSRSDYSVACVRYVYTFTVCVRTARLRSHTFYAVALRSYVWFAFYAALRLRLICLFHALLHFIDFTVALGCDYPVVLTTRLRYHDYCVHVDYTHAFTHARADRFLIFTFVDLRCG